MRVTTITLLLGFLVALPLHAAGFETEADIKQNQQGPERIENVDEVMAEVLGINPDPDKVMIYVFSDYDCPHCRSLSPRLDQLSENYADDVSVIYVPFPALQRSRGIRAAMATLCADQYGYRSELVTYLVDNWSDVDAETIGEAHQHFDDIASGSWRSCLTDDAMRQKQNEIIDTARELGISSVPTTIIDGYKITGGVDYDTLQQIVEFVK